MHAKLFGSLGSLFIFLFAVLISACSGTGQSAAGVEDLPGPLVELSVRVLPQKTAYLVGEPFEPAGLVVEGRFANSGVREISVDELGFDGFDSSVPMQEQQITVSYHGLTTQFAISINELEMQQGQIEV